MSEQSHKNALVTGGGRRIGRAIAEGLAADGWNVAIHCFQSREDADALANDLASRGVRATAICARLDAEEELAGLLRGAEKALGPISCLINNASVFEPDTIETVTADSWDRHMAVNMRAPLFLSQSFAKALGNNRRGNIVNIIDQRVWNPTPWFVSYAASKAGLWSLTQSLALALAPRIRVNAIGPGPTLPSPRQDEDDFRAQEAATPLGRGADPEEIAAAVRFILSASSMTGQMIALDGGQHLGWEYPVNPQCPKE